MKETRQDRLKSAIAEAGMTQTELARITGISQPTISDLFNKSGTGSKHIAKIAKALGVRPIWLDTGQGERYESDSSLSPDEAEVIARWRKYPPEQQRLILAQMRAVSDSLDHPEG